VEGVYYKEAKMNELFKQNVLVCKRCAGDLRSHLSEKLKRVLKKYGLSWQNTSTHEGPLTREQFESLCGELNVVIRNHKGPGRVTQLIAKVGNKATWVDILEPSDELDLAA
jgi:CRISPR/Cas system-associated endoribonuclease Cas2